VRSRSGALLTSAAATAAAARLLRRWPPGGAARWRRTNHRGEAVTLLEGPAVVLGATAGLLAARGVPARVRAGGAVAVLAAGALGGYDDLAGDGRRKGLAGHLGALAHGELTTGAVKLVGLAVAGVASAALNGTPARTLTSTPARAAGGRSRAARAVDALLGGAVVAGSANLLNLLDLRPGRALKALLLQAPWLLGGAAPAGPGAVALGSAAAALPDDLRERSMLGDCGANAAGALLGVAALGRLGARGRVAVLAALMGLTVASERVSFTRVIESTPGLRELDALGRRPRGGTPAGTGTS
jgi:UDP-N-acetylmuramyl pentapeptide phosphotransferase/UDP-N-acetylglucosamine-1-phosphate transferase